MAESKEVKPVAQQNSEQAGQQVRLRIDEKAMTTFYANGFRTNGTTDEVMLDCGVNIIATTAQNQAEMLFEVNQRIIMNYSSAKRLTIMLGQLIRRHEDEFGEIELDLSKRRKK